MIGLFEEDAIFPKDKQFLIRIGGEVHLKIISNKKRIILNEVYHRLKIGLDILN